MSAQTVVLVSADQLFMESAAVYLGRAGWDVATSRDALESLAVLGASATKAVLVLGGLAPPGVRALVVQIGRRYPDVSIIALSDSPMDEAAVLPRTATGPEVVLALRALPAVKATAGAGSDGVHREGIQLLAALTPQERRTLTNIIGGMTKAQIAERMNLSEHTVRTHQQNLYRKLGVHSKLELLRFAARFGLLADESDRVR